MSLKRHKITQRKWIERQFAQNQKLLSAALRNLSHVPGNLSSILDLVVKIIDFGSVMAAETSLIRESIQIGAQAARALFQKGAGGDGPVKVQVGDGPPVECVGHLDNSMITPGSWVFGFYF